MVLAAALLLALGAVELRWESVAGCPDAAVIERDLGALVGEGPPVGPARVTGRLRPEPDAYVLELEVEVAGRREARRLRAHDCGVLARAGVLVSAVTLDALATVARVDAREVPEPQPTPAPRAVVPVPPPAEPRAAASVATPDAAERAAARRPPARRGAVTLAAGAGVSLGLTPAPAGGIEGELGWRRGALRLGLAGSHWFPRAREIQPGVGIEAALSGGSLRACVAFERARLEVPLCAGLDLAAMHGGGTGSRVTRREVLDLWVGLAGGMGIAWWPTRRLALQARVDGVLAARRAGMYLVVGGQPREVFRMEPVGVRVLAGPLVRLW